MKSLKKDKIGEKEREHKDFFFNNLGFIFTRERKAS